MPRCARTCEQQHAAHARARRHPLRQLWGAAAACARGCESTEWVRTRRGAAASQALFRGKCSGGSSAGCAPWRRLSADTRGSPATERNSRPPKCGRTAAIPARRSESRASVPAARRWSRRQRIATLARRFSQLSGPRGSRNPKSGRTGAWCAQRCDRPSRLCSVGTNARSCRTAPFGATADRRRRLRLPTLRQDTLGECDPSALRGPRLTEGVSSTAPRRQALERDGCAPASPL